MEHGADTQHPLHPLHPLDPSQPPSTHLAGGGGGIPDLLCQPGQRADEEALPVKLLPQPLPAAAQQRRQQVLVPDAELRVLQAVLQQPGDTQGQDRLGTHPAWGHMGSGQAQGHAWLGDMQGQARLRVMSSLGTHEVRPGSGYPLVWGHVGSGQPQGRDQFEDMQGQARLGDPAGLGTHTGSGQAQGHTQLGDTRGQGSLREPPEPPNPPEEVVSDLEVTDGSLHEEAHQGTVQVALVLQGLHRGQCHSGAVTPMGTSWHIPVPPHTCTSWGR